MRHLEVRGGQAAPRVVHRVRRAGVVLASLRGLLLPLEVLQDVCGLQARPVAGRGRLGEQVPNVEAAGQLGDDVVEAPPDTDSELSVEAEEVGGEGDEGGQQLLRAKVVGEAAGVKVELVEAGVKDADSDVQLVDDLVLRVEVLVEAVVARSYLCQQVLG